MKVWSNFLGVDVESFHKFLQCVKSTSTADGLQIFDAKNRLVNAQFAHLQLLSLAPFAESQLRVYFTKFLADDDEDITRTSGGQLNQWRNSF